jgi:predicted nucleotidyltransferase
MVYRLASYDIDVRINGSVDISPKFLADFCQKWKITELALFGSALRSDFGPESDIDVLVTFEEGAPWTLFDFVKMQEEFSSATGRDVDIVERAAVEASRNPFRRRSILANAKVLYSVAAA